jgi:formylglycine-generating enzyme required for sulfatase activity
VSLPIIQNLLKFSIYLPINHCTKNLRLGKEQQEEKKMSQLMVKGKVSGWLLAEAMLHAQAARTGGIKAKQAAGVKHLANYLGANSARREAWRKQTTLSPASVLARASMSGKWLKKAGQLLEAVTDEAGRRALLGEIIAPHIVNVTTLFGSQIKERTGKPSAVKTSEIISLLEWQMPEIELEVVGIPAGTFPMGSTKHPDERPVRRVKLSAFGCGRYEVTNAQYEIYLGQTGYNAPRYWEDRLFGKEQPNNPVIGVNYYDSNAFALWQGGRLPTEAEGEYAARGPQGLIYPWGNEWDPLKLTFRTFGTRPVNDHPDGASPFGVMDLAGNVWEWRSDRSGAYDPTDLADPQGPKTGNLRVVRGGSWRSCDPGRSRTDFRYNYHPESRDDDVGFRLVRTLP